MYRKKHTHLHTTMQTQNMATVVISYYQERFRYINQPEENKLIQTTSTIINPERIDH